MSRKIRVLKASGKYEPFSKKKVRASLKRVGASKKLANEIIDQIEAELHDGIPTTEIYDKASALLRRWRPPVAVKYNLKRAVMELGPTGYPFEKFIAGVLAREGYKTETNSVVSGRCVSHEIDIIAKKGRKRCMVECKFHNKRGIRSDMKDALYVYARFLDVGESFDECWLVSNTKVTSQVRKYGKCVGIKVISWDYPSKGNLLNIIDQGELYPVTALDSISKSDKRRLLENGFVFCRDLGKEALLLLSPKKRPAVKKEIAGLP